MHTYNMYNIFLCIIYILYYSQDTKGEISISTMKKCVVSYNWMTKDFPISIAELFPALDILSLENSRIHTLKR